MAKLTKSQRADIIAALDSLKRVQEFIASGRIVVCSRDSATTMSPLFLIRATAHQLGQVLKGA